MNTEFKKIKIAVIGTGTAGCLQTLQFSQELNFEYFELDWIYDPETPIFGIGEATTPHIPQVLRRSKFSTDMLFNELKGSLKYGVRFFNWGKKNKKFVHDFGCGQYGVHMDTSALSEFTLKHIEKLKGTNIKVVPEKVDTIESLPSGCVVNGRNYNFVVDCSGYEPLLYKDEYIDSEIPTVDSAVIYRRKTPGKWNHTVHFAHENGWMFGIPLRDRQTWGYTFSSKFTTEEEAREGLQKLMPDEDVSTARYVTWKPRFASFLIDDNGVYARNGNAAGFMEPLQSLSGLHTEQITSILTDYVNDDCSKQLANEAVISSEKEWLEGLAYHYQMGSSFDTPFWNDVSKRAKEFLKLKQCSESDIEDIERENPRDIERLSLGCFATHDLLQLSYGLDTQTKDILSAWKFADWDSYGTESFWGSQNSIEDYLK